MFKDLHVHEHIWNERGLHSTSVVQEWLPSIVLNKID